jgi:thiol-disulfide isomerase/thioredoxin
MPKKARLKIALVAILLIACGTIAVYVFHANPLAKVSSETWSLDKLLVGMGVEVLPSSTSQVEVLLQDLNGADVNISDFRGKIVFLNFWATWCPTCVAEMPAMEKLHQTLKNKDFALVTVSLQESAAEVKRFFKQNQLTFTALLDSIGKTVPGFGIRAIPTTLILDKTGRIVGRVIGPREWDSRESIAMFKQLIDEHSADSKESRSMQQRLPFMARVKT